MKTALIFAEDNLFALQETIVKFLTDKNYLDYKILGILNDNSLAIESFNIPSLDKVRKLRANFSPTLEVTTPPAVNKFIYDFVDAIFILSAKNPDEVLNLFRQLKVEFRKIIFWSEDNSLKFIQFNDTQGNLVVCFEGLEFHVKNQVDAVFVEQTISRLENQKALHNLPRENYPQVLKSLYRMRMGKELDLDNPKTYTEKIQWLKLYDSTPLKTRLSDKYAAREWLENKIGTGHLTPLIGAWDNFDDINFDDLPDRFVLKCNHGSGMNYFVPNKNKLNMREARENINAWLAADYGMTQLELSYSNIKRKIIAEEYIDELADDIVLYRIYCFDGEPKFIRTSSHWTDGHHMFRQKFYDCQWRDLG